MRLLAQITAWLVVLFAFPTLFLLWLLLMYKIGVILGVVLGL